MRKLVFSIFIALFVGCNLTSSSSEPERIVNGFKISFLEEVKESDWGSGVFYQISEESGLKASSVDEVTKLLKEQISEGVTIESAWYKEGGSNCGTPNGIAYQVVVPSTVIVKLSDINNTNIPDIFELLEGKPNLICPFYVQKLQPVEN